MYLISYYISAKSKALFQDLRIHRRRNTSPYPPGGYISLGCPLD